MLQSSIPNQHPGAEAPKTARAATQALLWPDRLLRACSEMPQADYSLHSLDNYEILEAFVLSADYQQGNQVMTE